MDVLDLLHESEWNMASFFTSRKASANSSEITSPYSTTSVISDLFYT